ncbi:MAG TPA: hypothetical protein VN577_06525 [Terriglobales bacterium]|nr:hypothetical protein [Terriglobales bacterium]
MKVLKLLSLVLLVATVVLSQENRNVVRMVTWQPKPGMERQFEEGYKRHLVWHTNAKDPWIWHGWNINSGDRSGWFVDASFGHAWTDFDSPVNPSGDRGDNEKNVVPYADVRQVSTFEVVPAASNLDEQRLSSRLLTFVYLDIRPGFGGQFEASIASALQGTAAPPHALLRPANGTMQYLLLLAADKNSDLGPTSETVRKLLASISERDANLIQRVGTETASHRPDLSYLGAK